MASEDTSTFDTCCQCHENAATLQRCSCCQVAFYCGRQCQVEAWNSHKSVCKPPPNLPLSPPKRPVAGVHVVGGYYDPYEPYVPRDTNVHPSHPVWRKGSRSPVSQLVGVPLLIYRDEEELPLETPNIAHRDNQSITYLMIDPESGFAPSRWQKNIGEVTVVRADQKPLNKAALEMIFKYCDAILSDFNIDSLPPLERYNPESFQEFCRSYRRNMLAGRASEFLKVELPL